MAPVGIHQLAPGPHGHQRSLKLSGRSITPDWIWREEAITRLLASHKQGHLFVAGCKTNQGKFYSQFDHIALLSAPAQVLLARISVRDSNPYGKRPEERALILQYLAEVEPRLRATATIEIDAAAPISRVVQQLETLG